MRQHGYQQIDLPMRSGTQDGAQLRQKHGRVGQAPADGSQAQRRVQLRLLRLGVALQRFVGANVDCADGHRQTLHTFNSLAVGQILLFLVW